MKAVWVVMGLGVSLKAVWGVLGLSGGQSLVSLGHLQRLRGVWA